MTLLERNQMFALPGPQANSTWAPAPDAAADPFSFAYLLRVMRRRLYLFASVLLATVLVALIVSRVLPPSYSAQAKLMVDPRPHGSPVAPADGSTQPDASIVDSEVKVMTSPTVLGAVASQLNLARDREFRAPAAATDPAQAVTQNLLRHISVGRDGLTYIVSINATSHDRDRAAQIANAMAEQYLRESRLQREQLAADQARTLTAELGPLDRQVVDADEAVTAFRSAHGIIASGSSQGGTITDQQIASVAAELGKASADADAAQATAAAATSEAARSGVESVSEVLNSTSLAELRKQRAQVMHDQAQIATVYGPDHPASIRVNEELAKLNREIDRAATRIVRGLQSDAVAATDRETRLRAQLEALQARQETDARANVVALGLQRLADAKRTIYNDLSRIAQEQAQEARIGDARAYVVSAAEPPLKRSFPKTTTFLMLGLAFGATAGAGAVVIAEARERGYRTAEEVETALQLPFLAAVPELPAAATRKRRAVGGRGRAASPWNYVLEKPISTFAESIRNIRATLLADEPQGVRGRTVCITSAVSGEGKSMLAVALARVMAMSGDRVLLIDCDLRRSGLAPLRQEGTGPGLMDVLHGQAEPGAALTPDVVEGLNVLGKDGPVFTAKDIFSGPAAKDMLRRLEAEYDFVILDAPPVLAVTDAWTITSLCQATLLVVRHAKTPRTAVRFAVERLRLCGARLHGVVLNRRTRSRDDSGYYDSVHSAYYLN